MATPDYLQQVIISGRKRVGQDRRTYSTRFGLVRRPSVTSLVWASLDMMTVFAAGFLALRLHTVLPKEIPALSVLPHLIYASPNLMFCYLGWVEVADLIIKGLNGAIGSKRVTYDFARQMDGATEIKCSEFGDNIIQHM